MMIGQKDLIKKLNSYTINNFPHSILLVGERGSEQNEVCEYIAEKFDFALIDITENVDHDMIDAINQVKVPTLYKIDMSELEEKIQNILLKLYEEPNAYTYLILLCENDNLILDTIKTRSYRMNMDKYSREVLEPLVEVKEQKDLILDVCTTPGQVEIANHTDMNSLFDMCSRLPLLLKHMTFDDVLRYSDKINFSDEYDKYDLYIFIKVLKMCLLDNYRLYKSFISFEQFLWTMVDRIDGKRRFFDHIMISLWSASLVL